MNKFSIKEFLPGIAWFFIVLVLLCIPGNDLPNTGDWFNIPHFDKLVHTGLFGIMTFLFIYPILRSDLKKQEKMYYLIKISISLSLWGLTTEFIQKIVPNRSFDLLDWAADSAGVLIVFLGCLRNIQKP
jgi:hypothetical protein